MVATKINHPKTYEDYLKTPDDGHRYELIDGEIIVSASPNLVHQRAVQKNPSGFSTILSKRMDWAKSCSRR